MNLNSHVFAPVQALLRVGQTILNKRKRDVEENTFLKEKVAKVRQEEEERIRATAANQAARDALGKWSLKLSLTVANSKPLIVAHLNEVLQETQNIWNGMIWRNPTTLTEERSLDPPVPWLMTT